MHKHAKSGTIRTKAKDNLPRKLLFKLPILVIEMTPHGDILYVNDAASRATGYRAVDLMGMSFDKLFGKEDSAEIKAFLKLLKKRDVFNYEIDFAGKSGFSTVSFNTANVYDKNGNLKKIVALGSDVSKVKRVEGKLRRSEEIYRVLIENQGEGFTIVDTEERFTYANPAAEEIFGVGPRGLIGRSLEEFTSREQFALIREETEKRKKGERGNYECEIIRPDREIRYILVTTTPWLSESGAFEGAAGVFRDISSWKKAEEALRESEEKYRLLFENVADVIFTMDKDFRIVTISPSVESAIGYKPEDIVGRLIYELPMVPEEYLVNAKAQVVRVFEGETIHQSRYRATTKDGSVKSFSVTTTPLRKGSEIIGSLSVCREAVG